MFCGLGLSLNQGCMSAWRAAASPSQQQGHRNCAKVWRVGRAFQPGLKRPWTLNCMPSETPCGTDHAIRWARREGPIVGHRRQIGGA